MSEENKEWSVIHRESEQLNIHKKKKVIRHWWKTQKTLKHIAEKQEEFQGAWDLLILAVSIYTLFALLLSSLVSLPKEHHALLILIDNFLCSFFILDCLLRFIRADSKIAYLKWGWIDLLSSLPTIVSLRWGRIFRVLRIIRVLKSLRNIRKMLIKRLDSSFILVVFSAFTLTIFSASVILYVETDPNSTINTAEEALWWSFVTITTVGYGDHYPVTSIGRVLAGVLMSAGVGIFSVFTVHLTQFFLRSNEESHEEKLNIELKEVKERLARMEHLLEKLSTTEDHLKDD